MPGQQTGYDVIVVGAGFAGMYALHRLRGMGLSVRVFERGDGVGGTWYWNRYPGARCDVESLDYSYSFDEDLEQEWEWTERYPTQPEILRYLNHVADRFDLRRDIQLSTAATQAHYAAEVNRWHVRTSDGQDWSARFFITAAGCLSSVNRPKFEGLESFEGDWYHTGQWPHEGVDFTGKRVGFIGTGSTGIQAIPQIAKQAAHLHVFQRTPNFSMPAYNCPLSAEKQAEIKADYRNRRLLSRESAAGVPSTHPDVAPQRSALSISDQERARIYEEGWHRGGAAGVIFAFNDIATNIEANQTAADFVRRKIGEIVVDPEVAQRLMPHDHPIGTKRICVDTEYYETYNRDNVTLVDVRANPIQELTPAGLRTSAEEFELDAIVFAIGFDAMTGALNEIDIRGRDGVVLKDKWSAGPRTYLGLAVARFPNMFMITGPGSPSVLSNMVVSIEQHVDWITDCLQRLDEDGLDTIEARQDAEDEWVEHVNEVANGTLYPRANSWYMGANIPGKPRIFMPYVGGVGNYRVRCNDVAVDNYRGFDRSTTRIPVNV